MSLLKLQCQNSQLKYIGVFNLVVWLHMLTGLCWCMSAALFRTWFCFNIVTLASSYSALPDDSDYTKTCRSCFNVNFNTYFKALFLCISW
jgi:hypothetical protein